MFGKTFHLFTVFGFKIRIDVSWFVVAVLFTWSMATFFRSSFPELARESSWLMGLAGTLGLFASVVAHELAHALVARRYGLEMRGITLFIFGGVAEMTDEPPTPGAELAVAIAGPIASFALAVGLLGARIAGTAASLPQEVNVVVGYLALMNLVLAVFNLVPAFPLDGGRVLRSILWRLKGDLRRATRITSALGSAFGFLLIGLGVLRIVAWGDLGGGLWSLLIGLFVRNAAQMSYQQLLLRQILQGEPVSRFMRTEPVTVPRAISVEELVEHYVYRHHFKMFPVVDGDRLLGCVTTRQVRELPREEWATTTVGALARDCSDDNTVAPDTDALKALATMSRSGHSRLMVVDGDRLLGILALKDLLDFFALKIELEEA